MTRKQGEADPERITLHEPNKAKSKKELMKRLDYIQHLARQKNYTEIRRLLQESYV
jgi:hypothetical protein